MENETVINENEAGNGLDAYRDKVSKVIGEIEKVIVGKRPEIILLLTAMFAGSHVLIEDVPGTGKTTLAATVAKVTGLEFRRAQFTPDVMASDITGYNIYNRQKEEFEFRQGLVMCNLMLADEINRASPKTQSALLEAMEENKVTVDGVTYPVPDPFMVIATQNPTGYVGTYPLPEAQLDRFALKIRMGYPSPEEELSIVMARRGVNPLDGVENVISADDIRRIKEGVSDIRIDGELYRYIVSLVGATRKHGSLALGASPRASVALMKLSQAYAFIRGRSYVLPDDIAAIFRPAIGHRLMLKQDARLKGTTADEVLGEILRSTDVPYKGRRQ
ncbi:MAG: MoxR family ATPase [Clostridia bacterium]|nr:MoxR family ATPase [Clostridia bacterium]